MDRSNAKAWIEDQWWSWFFELPTDPSSFTFWAFYTFTPPAVLAAISLYRVRLHNRSLARREAEDRVPVSTARDIPETAEAPALLTANLVWSHSTSLFLFVVLRKLFGGPIPILQRTMNRARREVLLRLQDKAHARGYHALYGLRFESFNMGDPEQPSASSIEILAYATAVKVKGAHDGHSA